MKSNNPENPFRKMAQMLLLLALLLPAGINAATWYVNDSVTTSGAGTGWTTSFKTVQEGLNAAASGDSVWVAAGTYYPTTGTDRFVYIQLISGVSLYGGFDGTETSLSARDWETNLTILSGDIGTAGDETDNSVHVVSALDTTGAVIDGFIIEYGYAVTNPMETCDASGSLVDSSSSSSTIFRIVTDIQCKSGGGLYNVHADTIARNIIFRYNTAAKGGAVYNMATTDYEFTANFDPYDPPYFENVIFLENYGTTRGGAVNNDFFTNPSFVDVTFIRNHCDSKGGAVYGDFGSASYFVNVLFARNTAERAGAVANDGNSSSIFAYTTIVSNIADDLGAALYQGTYLSSEKDGISTTANEPHLYDSYILGNSSDASPSSLSNWHDGAVIYDAESTVEETDGSENVDSFLFSNYDTQNSAVGWYEARDTASISAALLTQFAAETTRQYSANSYVSVPTGSNSGVIRVDADASAGGDGASWATAYKNLQPAIAAAASGAEIWVADGTYYPTRGTGRGVSFEILNGVALYGGFNATETNRTDRNAATNLTYLDGDIGTLSTATDNSYHVVVAIISGNATANTGVIDGFIIQNGYADGDFEQGRGGGILIQENAAPTVDNNTIQNNYALEGGGISVYDQSHPNLSNNLITNNTAERGGGMLIRVDSSPVLDGTDLTNNTASDRGGALFIDYGSDPTFANCQITGNSSVGHGGGLYSDDNSSQYSGTTPAFSNCTFSGNTTSGLGGAIYLYGSLTDATGDTLTITGNTASQGGGGVAVDFGSTWVCTSCTVSSNTPDDLYEYDSNATAAVFEVHNDLIDIDNGSSVIDFGSVAVGSSATYTISLWNRGSADLTFSNTDPIQISGTNAGDFSVDSQPASSVTLHRSVSATLIFTPSSTGSRTAEVTIANDSSNATSYTFTLTGTGTGTSSNTAPTASSLSLSGTLTVGNTLSGSYTYSDADNDTESGSTYAWYRADDVNGTSAAAISGATFTSYGLTSSDETKYIAFAVTPSDGSDSGTQSFSSYSGPIAAASTSNTAPTASNIGISGISIVGESLSGSYTYTDADGDLESGSSYVWYRADDVNGTSAAAISGATSSSYTLTSSDDTKYIAFSVTPSDGTDNGSESISSYQGAISTSTGNTIGLISNTGNAEEGYTLFAPIGSTTTYLIDNTGDMVHSWPSTYRPGLSTYLLEDGRLLRTGSNSSAFTNNGSNTGGSGGVVEIIEWDGTVTWTYDNVATDYLGHHDVAYLPSGNVLMVAWETKDYATSVAAGRDTSSLDTNNYMWSERLIEVNPTTNEIVWEWYAWDHVVQDFDSTQSNFGTVADQPERIDINYNTTVDWLHINSIDYNSEFDQILLSVHSFSEVWIIDHSTTTAEAATSTGGTFGKGGDLLYRWGNPRAYDQGTIADRQLFSQHDAKWIETGDPGAGNITIYSNGTNRNGPSGDSYSTIEEIILPVDSNGNYSMTGSTFDPTSPTWTYTAATPTDFYSSSISGAQRQSNGNTLICEGESGNFFEVDNAGNTVWQYINPVSGSSVLSQGETATSNSAFRAERYPTTFAGFTGRNLHSRQEIENANGTSPSAVDIAVSGSYSTDQVLTGSYTYLDSESDTESGTTLQWYRADDTSSTNATAISGATSSSYTITTEDEGSYIAYAVTPSDGTNTSQEYVGAYGGAVPSTSTNTAPTASSVTFSGTQQVGELLTGSYTYADADSDTESGSTYQWYRATDSSGTSATAITGATLSTYTLTSSDEASYIAYSVTPADGTDSGTQTFSSYMGAIAAAPTSNTAPTASSVSISGTAQVGEMLIGSYTYADADSDTESGSAYQWYRADDSSGTSAAAISGASSSTYTLATSDEAQYIAFSVTPSDGTDAGTQAFSSYLGAIAAASTGTDICSGATDPTLSNITVANGDIQTCSVTGVITVSSSVLCESGGILNLVGSSIQIQADGLTAESGCTLSIYTQ